MADVGGISVWVINICVVLLLNLFSTASGKSTYLSFVLRLYLNSIFFYVVKLVCPTISKYSTDMSYSGMVENCNLLSFLKGLGLKFFNV